MVAEVNWLDAVRLVLVTPGPRGSMKPIFELCDVVRQAAYELHVFLGHGHLEKVYQNGLWHRLRRQGVLAIQQHPLVVQDEDGMVLGEYQADLLVEGF